MIEKTITPTTKKTERPDAEIEKLPMEERQRRNRIYDHYAPEE